MKPVFFFFGHTVFSNTLDWPEWVLFRIIDNHRERKSWNTRYYSGRHFTEELTGPFWKRATQKRKEPLPFVYRASWPIVYKKLHRKLDVKVARLMRFLTCNDFASWQVARKTIRAWIRYTKFSIELFIYNRS